MRILPIVRVLLLVALGVDSYLAWVSLTGSGVAGCGPDSSCHAVLGSKWAYWWGVPVSVPALAMYLALLGSTFWLTTSAPASLRSRAWQVALTSSLVVIGAGLWFIALQLFVLRAICPWCMTAHASALVASFLVLTRGRPAVPTRKGRGEPTPAVEGQIRAAPALAAGLVGLLVLGQLLYHPKTYVSTPVTAGIATNNPSAPIRQFQLFDNEFTFNLAEVPLLGRPDAAHVMVSLFDYTCHHCRQLHGSLVEAQRRFSNDLAVISLPMPLDPKCNPLMRQPIPDHVTACALARIGLTVWRADPQAFRAFDDWAFGAQTTPQVTAAEQFAFNLIGTNAFNKAASDPWIDSRLQQDIAIYKTVYLRYRKSTLPELIIGTNLLSGTFDRAKLDQLLAEQYGLGAPTATNAPAQSKL